MKFQQKMASDFPPEISQKYLADEGALKYLEENLPDISKIEVVTDRTEGNRRTVELKYTTEMSLPGPIKKVMGGAASQTMLTRFSVDTENHSGTMEMIPSQMADKIKVSAKISVAKEGNSWVQSVDGDATVKIFGVGKMIEKFLVEKIQSSSESETRLRNAYVKSVEG
jgi:hypothetical protein